MANAVRQTDRTHFQEIEEHQAEPKANEKSSSGFALHQIFSQDTLQNTFLPIEMLAQTAELESKTPSFWRKIFPWWYQPDVKAQTPITPTSDVDLLEVDDVEPISPVPKLDDPDSIPADLEAAKLPPGTKKIDQKERLTNQQLYEAATSSMSDRTIEQIMFIIFKAQLELEKENANCAEKTFSKYQDLRKVYEKMLPQIKDALERDVRVMDYFKTAQNIAFYASAIAGVAALCVASGGAAFLPALAVTLITVAGPALTATLTGLTLIPKAIYQRMLDQDQAKKEEFNYQDKYYTDRIDDSRERLVTISEADNEVKNRWITLLLKRLQKMNKLVLEK
jgi:hypothetical protein